MSLADPRCEYHVNPIGIGITEPRLSWRIDDARQGSRQVAYRVLVSSREGGDADLWDSGRVESDQSIHVKYAGKPLGSRQRAYWSVTAWVTADDGRVQEMKLEQPAFFEIGLSEHGEWKGKWIASDLAGGKHVPVAAPFVRREFSSRAKLVSARLYATALGVYVASINGRRVGEDIFAPGWTDYRKRVQYQVHDVTELVRDGHNAIGFVLGDGWYAGRVAHHPRQVYGDRPRLLAQLELTYADGSKETIATDESWRFSAGPILESDMLQGESYDARREMSGWDTAGYDARGWRAMLVMEDPGIAISATDGSRVRRQEELRPVVVKKYRKSWDRDAYLVDLGQNMVGWVRLKAKGSAGQTVTLRFAEILDAQGKIYTENLRSARATDYYTLKGDAAGETYEPTFTFHGFRYVEVDNYPGELTADAITGVVVHSAMERTGEFECSDPLLNQLQSNIRWGQKGNYLEVPTDCPQRDERMGWTGDAQVFVRTGAWNFNVALFFAKWQQDLEDAQGQDGRIPPVVPNPDLGGNGGPAWADAHVICPWTMYLCYGDTEILRRHYASLKKWAESLADDSLGYIRAHPSKGWGGFGDWLATDNGRDQVSGRTPSELIGTAFYAYVTELMARIAGLLGETEDQQTYEQLNREVRKAFNKRYITHEGLIYAHTQTAYVLALHFGLVPEKLRFLAAEQLVKLIRDNGMHLTTGFVGSPYINHVLGATGHLDTAYRLLFQQSWPSWLYAVTQGATTIWERWDGWTHDKGFQSPGMNSFNHYAYGAIGAWLYQCVAGIEIDPEKPAYKHVIIRPQLAPEGAPGLEWAKASVKSMYGTVSSSWKKENGNVTLEVTIPPNTTASVYVPGKTEAVEVGAGTYRFEADANAND